MIQRNVPICLSITAPESNKSTSLENQLGYGVHLTQPVMVSKGTRSSTQARAIRRNERLDTSFLGHEDTLSVNKFWPSAHKRMGSGWTKVPFSPSPRNIWARSTILLKHICTPTSLVPMQARQSSQLSPFSRFHSIIPTSTGI